MLILLIRGQHLNEGISYGGFLMSVGIGDIDPVVAAIMAYGR